MIRFRAPLAIVAAAVALVVTLSAPSPASAATTITWPAQSVGDRGTDVLAIQHLLRGRLDPGQVALPPTDGQFRTATAAAVKAFQRAHGQSASGVVTGTTWARLILVVGAGSTGEAVTALQVELVGKRRAAVSVTGTFDAATTSAVRAFQSHMRLAITGVADLATWRALTWHYERPVFGANQLCDYSVGNGPANWGTAEAIATLTAVGRRMVALGYGRVAVGDISFEHGGAIPGHTTHRQGLDVDVRPLRKASDQCSVGGTTWRSSAYDRTATRTMIQRFRAYAPGHIKVIYFNDPVLIREGLTTWFSGHDDHVHVRFCEARHPVATYDC